MRRHGPPDCLCSWRGRAKANHHFPGLTSHGSPSGVTQGFARLHTNGLRAVGRCCVADRTGAFPSLRGGRRNPSRMSSGGTPGLVQFKLTHYRRLCCERLGEPVESLVAGPPVSNGEWTARKDGGPSIRTRVEPEGHRKAPPPVLKAPHRTMWGFSLWTRDRGFAPPVGHAPRRSGSEERPRTPAVRCAIWCVNCTLE